MVKHAVHNQMHPALVHFSDQFLEVLHVAQQWIYATIINSIIAMIGAAAHHRIYINSNNSKLFQLVKLCRNACQVATKDLVAMAVADLVGNVIVVDRNPLWLVQSQLHICAVKIAVQAIILCPAAIDRNLVKIWSGRQIHRIGI